MPEPLSPNSAPAASATTPHYANSTFLAAVLMARAQNQRADLGYSNSPTRATTGPTRRC